jgi:invasion protein IalB
MISSAKLALFAGLILAASPAVASPAPTPAAPATASPAAPVQKLYAQTYGDWTYRCLAAAAAGQPVTTNCFVQQQLVFSNNGHTSPLLTVTFLKAVPKGHSMNIVAPLGVALRAGVEMSVDSGKPTETTYSFCNNNGCAVIDAPAFAITRDIHNAKTGHAKIGLMNGKPLTINFSLKGLAQALAALDSGVMPKTEIQPG